MHEIGTTDRAAQRVAEQAAEDAAAKVLDGIFEANGFGAIDGPGDEAPAIPEATDPAPDGGSADTTEADEASDPAPAGEQTPAEGLSADHLRALNRAHVPEALRQSIPAEELEAWAEQLREQQANVDSYTARMRELEAKVAATSTETSDQPAEANHADDGDEEGNQPDESDADPAADFAALFGDDAAKPVVAMAEKVRADFEARAQALEAKYAEQAATLAAQQRTLEVQTTALRVLAPWNPTDAQRLEVGKRMDELASAEGASVPLDSLTERAARDVLGPPPSERGTMTPPSRAPMNTRPLTLEERADRVLDMVLDGKKPAEIKAALR